MRHGSRPTALFLSHVQPSEQLTEVQLEAAIRASLRAHGGTAGCTAALAAEYGQHPDTAPARMRWAVALLDRTAHAVAA